MSLLFTAKIPEPDAAAQIRPAAPPTGTPPEGPSQRGEATRGPDAERFVQQLRAERWNECMPLVACVLGGAALLFVAGAAPPGEAARALLEAREIQDAAAVHALGLLGPASDYQLPLHWAWPKLSMLTDTSELIACAGTPPDARC